MLLTLNINSLCTLGIFNMGIEGARFEVVHELPCVSREKGGSADIKNGG